jgi:histidinol-phosphate phosphatase family protein
MFGKSLNRQAVIVAGGKGTRLKALLGELPKAMIPIGGKPLLEHQIELARRHGFTDILVLAGHQAEAIEAYCGDGSRWGVRIECRREEQPLGTAGAVAAAFDKLKEQFVVLYGDEMANVDLGRLWAAHLAARAEATLVLHPNDHPLDSDLVEVDAAGWITAFHNRPHPPGGYFQNLVNAALYVVSKPALAPWAPPPQIMDFGKDVFPAMLRGGARLLGYRSPEYIKDVGTPERYELVCAEYASGVVERSSLSRPQPAVFLDRDGTLNRETGGVTAPEQLELLPGVAGAIRQLNHHGLRAVVTTNQPLVAKGFCTEADLQLIHNKLETLLGREGAFLDRIYYCPHHPEKGFPGERAELKVDCACRKPKPGLIYQATRELNLDLPASWLIGDSTADLETARQAGLRSILVRTGYAGQDGKFNAQPDLAADTLAEAVRFIIATRTR